MSRDTGRISGGSGVSFGIDGLGRQIWASVRHPVAREGEVGIQTQRHVGPLDEQGSV
ncbi:hypothetical protein [Pseudolysinimonas sp.]|uniref:hypothetical protein n=1 Tax=Pseudolysinimonas sp. TaxID=2680009 RepID=UPI00286B123A|nr:hypothetical protein [Pseudolysinimonas sp.]